MAKPEWGKKRTCTSCGAMFYDMKKNPAACPKCGTEDDLQPLLKPRRTGPVAKPAPKPDAEDAPKDDDIEDSEDLEIDDDDDAGLIVEDDEDDLGDDEDVKEVKERM